MRCNIFCTSGVLMTPHVLLGDEPSVDEERIRALLSGDLYRCVGYMVEAALEAREHRVNEQGPDAR